MEVIIKGEPKEIAALVLAVQERQDFDLNEFCKNVESNLEKSIVESAENICLYRKSSQKGGQAYSQSINYNRRHFLLQSNQL